MGEIWHSRRSTGIPNQNLIIITLGNAQKWLWLHQEVSCFVLSQNGHSLKRILDEINEVIAVESLFKDNNSAGQDFAP